MCHAAARAVRHELRGGGRPAAAIDWDAQPRELNQGYVHSCLEATLYASPVRSLVFLVFLLILVPQRPQRSSPQPFFRLPPSLNLFSTCATCFLRAQEIGDVTLRTQRLLPRLGIAIDWGFGANKRVNTGADSDHSGTFLCTSDMFQVLCWAFVQSCSWGGASGSSVSALALRCSMMMEPKAEYGQKVGGPVYALLVRALRSDLF